MGNPRFLLVLAIELLIGLSAKTFAEYQSRGDKFWEVQWLPVFDMYPASLALCALVTYWSVNISTLTLQQGGISIELVKGRSQGETRWKAVWSFVDCGIRIGIFCQPVSGAKGVGSGLCLRRSFIVSAAFGILSKHFQFKWAYAGEELCGIRSSS